MLVSMLIMGECVGLVSSHLNPRIVQGIYTYTCSVIDGWRFTRCYVILEGILLSPIMLLPSQVCVEMTIIGASFYWVSMYLCSFASLTLHEQVIQTNECGTFITLYL